MTADPPVAAAESASAGGFREAAPAQPIFALLAAQRRTWAVGAVHGEAERLAALHGHLAARLHAEDNLVYLGNMLGRGANVAGTVHELLLFRRELMARQIEGEPGDIVFLRGSQEEMWHKLLQVQFAPNPRQVLEWMLTQGVGATLEAYGGDIGEGRRAAAMGAVALSQWTNRLRATVRSADGHERLMTALRRCAYSEDGTLLFVSAGIDPGRPLSQQSDTFWWGGRDFDALDQPYAGFRRVVRGYDARHRGVVIKETTASIDGGCGFGGKLVAACFDGAGEMVDLVEV